MNSRNIVVAACLIGTFTPLVHAEENPNTEALWAMDIEQLLKVKITSASRFSESTLTSPSSVSVKTR